MKKYIFRVLASIALAAQGCSMHPDTGIKEYKFLNGKTQFSYTYKNGILNGPYKAFYETGTLWAEGNYVDEQLTGPFKVYTPEGQLATEEEYKMGHVIYQKIYWQPIPYDEKNFLFCSSEGFVTVKDGKSVPQDSNTPDNIIQEKFNSKTKEIELYIWAGGKLKLYKTLPL